MSRNPQNTVAETRDHLHHRDPHGARVPCDAFPSICTHQEESLLTGRRRKSNSSRPITSATDFGDQCDRLNRRFARGDAPIDNRSNVDREPLDGDVDVDCVGCRQVFLQGAHLVVRPGRVVVIHQDPSGAAVCTDSGAVWGRCVTPVGASGQLGSRVLRIADQQIDAGGELDRCRMRRPQAVSARAEVVRRVIREVRDARPSVGAANVVFIEMYANPVEPMMPGLTNRFAELVTGRIATDSARLSSLAAATVEVDAEG